jgi:hypothetical protein
MTVRQIKLRPWSTGYHLRFIRYSNWIPATPVLGIQIDRWSKSSRIHHRLW